MADEIDAPVHRAQPAASDPASDRIAADPVTQKLLALHCPVLPVGKGGDDLVWSSRSDLGAHNAHNPGLAVRAPLPRYR